MGLSDSEKKLIKVFAKVGLLKLTPKERAKL
jgi:hypothetical protein